MVPGLIWRWCVVSSVKQKKQKLHKYSTNRLTVISFTGGLHRISRSQGEGKKRKTPHHISKSSWLNLQFSLRRTPTKDVVSARWHTRLLFGLFRLHCFQAASDCSPFLVSATGGFVLSDGWTRSPFMHLCRFSLVGSLKSDFAPSCTGTTHVPARPSGAGVPPYRDSRAIRPTNRLHVGEK